MVVGGITSYRTTGETTKIIANYAKAIRYVHDETVKDINQGLTLEQMRQQIRLPDELARLPYLAPIYGRVEWSVNGIYRKYTGWYDFNPAHLNPGTVSTFHRALMEASDGAVTLALFHHSLQRIFWNPYSERLYARINVSGFL